MLKFIKDTALNMASNFLVIISLQLLFFPEINKSFNQDQFGIFLSLIAVVNLYSITLGTALSNLYLKYYSLYKERKTEKLAFKLHFQYLNIFNFIILALLFLILILFKMEYILSAIIIIFCLLMSNRMFLIAWYRVRINYKKIFTINLFLSVLYCIFCFFKYNSLSMVFFALLIIELIIFLIIIVTLIRGENISFSFSRERHVQINNREIFYLILSNVCNNSLNYMDRWIITILLNPLFVPIYYVSTLTIKIFNQPLNVLSNVIFSYVSNMNSVNKKNKIILLIVAPCFSGTTFILGILIGPMIINKIYPTYINDAMDIYWIINLALSLAVMDFIFRGYLMKFYPLKYKMIIDLINMTIFVVLSIILTNHYKSLIGIAYAQFISYAVKNTIQYILILKLKSN